MNHYIDIFISQKSEIHPQTLMNLLYGKFHNTLVKFGFEKKQVGVSFPKVNQVLGNLLRLHGTKETLESLMITHWTEDIQNYINISATMPTPKDTKFRLVKRIQTKSNPERLRRRSIAKGWLTKEEAIARIPAEKERKLKQPFLKLQSGSTGQSFCLFIEHSEILDQPRLGTFSCYGLSSSATVPWF